MRLTTKGRFAVTAMIDVALYGARGPVTLAAISERQKISLSYLAQLFGSKELKMDTAKLIMTVLIIQLVAIGGAYLFAFLSKAFNNIRALIVAPISLIGMSGRPMVILYTSPFLSPGVPMIFAS